MRLTRISIPALCACALLAASTAAHAGSFDCSVIYDEFESLMNKQFLMQPDQFVGTLPGRISREQFEGVSDADFHLYPGREGMGIGILTTNKNIHAKFLFHWSQPMIDDTTHVIIDEVVKYGRVEDGYSPSRIGPFRLKPGMSIDIDSASYVPVDGDLIPDEEQEKKRASGDLKYETGPDGVVLESVNDAEVQFPLETMCRQDS